MQRDSRLLLEVVVDPRIPESTTNLVYGAVKRLADGNWPLWSSGGWEPFLLALTVIFGVEELIPLKQISTSLL